MSLKISSAKGSAQLEQLYFRCQRIVIVMAVGSNVAESH
jgi:hypothetical protein